MIRSAIILLLLMLGQSTKSQTKLDIVDIGGIEQIIQITENEENAPLLLFLHGGAANNYSLIDKDSAYTSIIDKHFTTVLWDQREYGKTYKLNKTEGKIGYDLMVEDTKQLVQYLLKTYRKEKLFLVGHSLGSTFAMGVASKYPELVKAVIAVSPPVDGVENQCIALKRLKDHFKKENNARAIKELASIDCPTIDFEDQFLIYVWQTEFDGQKVTDEMRSMGKPVLEKMMEKSANLVNEVFYMDFKEIFPVMEVPIYILNGRHDFTSNGDLSFDYFKCLKAPEKDFFWFEDSAHQVPDTESEKMQNIIIQIMQRTRN